MKKKRDEKQQQLGLLQQQQRALQEQQRLQQLKQLKKQQQLPLSTATPGVKPEVGLVEAPGTAGVYAVPSDPAQCRLILDSWARDGVPSGFVWAADRIGEGDAGEETSLARIIRVRK